MNFVPRQLLLTGVSPAYLAELCLCLLACWAVKMPVWLFNTSFYVVFEAATKTFFLVPYTFIDH